MFVSWQKYGDEVKVDTMAYDINAGDAVPPTANPFPTRFASFLPTLVHLSACIYTLLRTNELYILSYFLASLIVDGRSAYALGTLTCDYAAGLVLYSLHVHVLAPLLIAHGPPFPLDDQS